MTTKITFLLCFFMLQGCYSLEDYSHNIPVWRAWMFKSPPPGREYPELYKLGWVDGCESGAASSANHFYKMRYSFKQDWQLNSNNVYRKGWDDAWNYCTTTILKHNWESVGRRVI